MALEVTVCYQVNLFDIVLQCQYRMLIGTLGYPAVALIVVDPAAMDLLGWPIGLHQQLLNRKNVEVDQLKVLILGLSGS